MTRKFALAAAWSLVLLVCAPPFLAAEPPAAAPVKASDQHPPPLATIPARELPTVFDPKDAAFVIRLDEIAGDKGAAAEFAYLERAFQRRPRPHLRAAYGGFLYFGRSWGAPPGHEALGLKLATEALKEGSVRSLFVLGWALMDGKLAAHDAPRAYDYFRRGANAGDPLAMLAMGDFCTTGSPEQAKYWYEMAAANGYALGLFNFAKAYESGRIGGTPDWAKACRFYYEASIHRLSEARDRLKELADQNNPQGQIFHARLMVKHGIWGSNLQSQLIVRAADYVAATCPDDPEALNDLGTLYHVGYRAGYFDTAKARVYLEKAAKLGSLDARAHLAYMLIEGIGCKKDPEGGLAELRKLEALNNSLALGLLGFYHYWGTLGAAGWTKSPALAFYYCKRAADNGDPDGARNLSFCYGDGIGVPKNYALAAVYARNALYCDAISYPKGRKLIDSYLAFVGE